MRPAIAAMLMTGTLACGGADPPARPTEAAASGATYVVRDTVIESSFEVSGIAGPVERAVLSTKLTGSVTRVLVQEGDRVRRGALLAQIDARDIDAKRTQVEASVSAAEAVHREATTQAARFRALYADSAATRYQLDQVETGLARAEAALGAARASGAELDAVGDYANISAPFAGLITQRFADPGAFVAPGSPVIEIQRDDRLRLSVTVPPATAQELRAGQVLQATIEGREALAEVEGVFPVSAGAVYSINAIVANPKGEFLVGGAATLRIPQGQRRTILLPASALIHEGDLTGVRVRTPAGTELRFLKVAAITSAVAAPSFPVVEVLSGLRVGDVILVEGD